MLRLLLPGREESPGSDVGLDALGAPLAATGGGAPDGDSGCRLQVVQQGPRGPPKELVKGDSL